MPSLRLLVVLSALLCACCARPAASAAPVDWAHLTVSSIAAVAPADFLQLTAAQLASVPSDACRGISQAQMSNIGGGNSSACAGITRSCTGELTAAAVSGLQADCLRAIPAASFNLSAAAVPALPLALVSAVSSAQFAALPLAAVSALTVDEVAQLSLDVCAHLDGAMLRALGPDIDSAQCGGLSAACVRAVPPASFHQVTISCLWSMQSDVLGALSAAQASEIQPFIFSRMSSDLGSHLSADFCSALSSDDINAMTEGGSANALLGLTSPCLAALNSTACATLNSDALILFEDAGLAPHLSALAFSCVASFSCSLWNDIDVRDLQQTRAALNASALVLLDARCEIHAPIDWTSLDASAMSKVDPVALLSLTAAQLASLADGACSGLTRRQMRSLGVNQVALACAGMTPLCASQLSDAAVEGVQVECLRAIPATSMDLSNPQELPLPLVRALSSAQMAALGARLRVLTAAQVGALSLDVCSNMSAATLAFFEDGMSWQAPPQCSGFSAACVQAMPNASFALVKENCLAHMQADVLAGLGAAQAAYIPSSALNDLSAVTTGALSADFCSALSGYTLGNWGLHWFVPGDSARPLQGLTSQCLGALSADACASSEAWSGGQPVTWLQNFASASLAPRLAALSERCVASLPCDAWGVVQANSDLHSALSAPALQQLSARCTPRKFDDHKTLVIALMVVGIVLGCLALAAAVWYCRRKRRTRQQGEGLDAQLLQAKSQAQYAYQHSQA